MRSSADVKLGEGSGAANEFVAIPLTKVDHQLAALIGSLYPLPQGERRTIVTQTHLQHFTPPVQLRAHRRPWSGNGARRVH